MGGGKSRVGQSAAIIADLFKPLIQPCECSAKNANEVIGFLPRRRSIILGGLAAGSLLLNGCTPELTRQHGGNMYGVRRNRAAGQQRARDVFHAIDNRLPIPVNTTEPLLQLETLYQEGKQRFDSLIAQQRKGIELEQFIDLVATPLAHYVRALFDEAVRNDLANSSSGEKARYQDGVFHIPHGHVIGYVQKGYCMDPNLPAPGKNDALELRSVAERIPAELQPLFKALGRWAARPNNRSRAQAATWAIMGAGTDSPWAQNISRDSLRVLEEAMPGGADAFRDYHRRNQIINSLVKISINGRPIRPSDLADPVQRDRIANNLLSDLVRQGDRMTEGKGVGYAELGDGVFARAWGESSLTPRVEVVNVSGKPVVYDPLDYFAEPVVAKQSVSGTQDITSPTSRRLNLGEGGQQRSPNELGANLFKDLLKYVSENGLWSAIGRPLANTGKTAAAKIGKFLKAKGIPKLPPTGAVKGLQRLLSATPLVGNALSLYECLTGRDWLTGEDLSAAERLLAGMGTIPGANTLKGMAGGLRAITPSSAVARQLENWQGKGQIFQVADKAAPYLSGYNLFLSGSAKEINTMIRGESDAVVGAFEFNENSKKALAGLTMESDNAMPWNSATRQVIGWIRTGHVVWN